MKIFAVTVEGASTAYRYTQYLPELEEIDDLVFIQKKLLPLREQKALRKKAKKLVFDFDDAIWTRPHKPYSWLTSLRVKSRLHYWLKKADIVICSSSFLASYAAKFCTPHILPMALDTALWYPKPQENPVVTLGWAGAPHNLHHLERLEPILKQLPYRLHVFCGKKPALSIPYTYFPYDEKTQISFIQGLDIGLLPLSDEEFSLGKSPIKAIQYIACGVPVVGNVYGATADILKKDFSFAVTTEEEWTHSLKKLASDKLLRQSMGAKARAFALEHHSRAVVAKQLINLLKG